MATAMVQLFFFASALAASAALLGAFEIDDVAVAAGGGAQARGACGACGAASRQALRHRQRCRQNLYACNPPKMCGSAEWTLRLREAARDTCGSAGCAHLGLQAVASTLAVALSCAVEDSSSPH